MLWEVFVRRFEDAFEQYERGRLTGEEAGELLGMSGRNFRRLCVRYEEDGIEGLRDRRLGKVSPRRAPAGELARMQALYRECYGDFTVKHFHEQLVKLHHYKLCYTVTKASLQAAGLVAKAKSAVAPTASGGSAGRCRHGTLDHGWSNYFVVAQTGHESDHLASSSKQNGANHPHAMRGSCFITFVLAAVLAGFFESDLVH